MSDWEGTSALKAEWLQLRGYLFDPVTRLPSLPAVLDEVRRRLEAGERLTLIYLDLSSGGHAEAVCGWQTHDRWLLLASRILGACRGDLIASTDIIAQLGVRSDEMVVVVGDTVTEVERLPDRLVARLAAAQREDEELSILPAPQAAGVMLEPKPRFRLERAIYGAVARARERCRQEIERWHTTQLEELHRLVRASAIVVRYQPILALDDLRVHGYEALAGAPDNSIFENPEMLFSFAEEHADIVSLERVCRRQAIAQSPALLSPARLSPERPPASHAATGVHLFLNTSPLAFQDPQLLEDLLPASATCQIVLEVTERVAVTEWRAFRRTLERIREAGLLIALDDVGAGYSSLQAIGEIEPDYLKFDFSLIHGLHESPIKRELVRTLGNLATTLGARAIAEGIETAEELEAVRDLGVELGQGFYFGHPAEPANLRLPTL